MTQRRGCWDDYGTSAAPLARRHPGHLAHASLSRHSALTGALAATGHPAAAAALTAVTTSGRTHDLRNKGIPTGAALRLAAEAVPATGGMLATAIRRTWWPLALLSRHGRCALVASLVPCLLQGAGHRNPVRWTLLRIADDLAYSAGVWTGCLRHRTLAPLLPWLTGRTP